MYPVVLLCFSDVFLWCFSYVCSRVSAVFLLCFFIFLYSFSPMLLSSIYKCFSIVFPQRFSNAFLPCFSSVFLPCFSSVISPVLLQCVSLMFLQCVSLMFLKCFFQCVLLSCFSSVFLNCFSSVCFCRNTHISSCDSRLSGNRGKSFWNSRQHELDEKCECCNNYWVSQDLGKFLSRQ